MPTPEQPKREACDELVGEVERSQWHIAQRIRVALSTQAAELERVKAELAAVRGVAGRIANIAHHGGYLGFKDESSAMNEIRRLSVGYWDTAECDRLHVLK